jgi:hypothetical protein
MQWSSTSRDYWQVHGPAPATRKWRDFPRLRVSIKSASLVPDYFQCGSKNIVSTRLRNLLVEECGIGCAEFHEVIVAGNNLISSKHYILNVLYDADPIDHGNSIIDFYDEEAGGGVEALALLKSNPDHKVSLPLFALFIEPTTNIVSASLKNKMQENDIKGSMFVRLDGFTDFWRNDKANWER